MKKHTRDYSAVREFVTGTKLVLDKKYSEEPEEYNNLKLMSIQSPNEYEEYITDILQNVVDKIDEEQEKERELEAQEQK